MYHKSIFNICHIYYQGVGNSTYLVKSCKQRTNNKFPLKMIINHKKKISIR